MSLDLYGKYFKIAFWLIIIIETLSFLSHTFSILNQALFFLIIAVTFFVSLRRLEYGFWIASVEMFIGSFGYMFFYDFGAFRFSVRLGIFLAVFFAWLITAIRRKKLEFRHTNLWLPWLILIIILVWGISIGLLHHNTIKNVFFDANAYLYLGFIFVVFSILTTWERINQWIQLLLAAVTTMALKTFFLLFYFSHQTDEGLIRMIYTWVRDTRVGEISLIAQNYYRIFFQSHIWSLFVFLIMLIFLIFSKKHEWGVKNYRMIWLATFLTSTTLIISFSRSLWLALGLSMIMMLAYYVAKRKISWLKLAKIATIIIIVAAVEVGFITLLVNIKLPGGAGSGASVASLIKERSTETQEAAIGSRFQLLSPLLKKYSAHPLLGSGFGTTVTYQTLDPRTKEVNGGQYTSYAFEWGYLDIGVKVGIIGLLIYLYFIWRIFRNGWTTLNREPDVLKRLLLQGFLLALFALIITHSTTPYLNHPLGIFLLLCLAANINTMQRQQIAPDLK